MPSQPAARGQGWPGLRVLAEQGQCWYYMKRRRPLVRRRQSRGATRPGIGSGGGHRRGLECGAQIDERTARHWQPGLLLGFKSHTKEPASMVPQTLLRRRRQRPGRAIATVCRSFDNGRQMMSYWASLAANGTAGSGWDGTPPLSWPQYESVSRTSIAFDTPAPSLVARYKADICDFWDAEIGYNMY